MFKSKIIGLSIIIVFAVNVNAGIFSYMAANQANESATEAKEEAQKGNQQISELYQKLIIQETEIKELNKKIDEILIILTTKNKKNK